MQAPENAANPIDALTEVRPSSLHGMGVFAKQDIPKGTVWWRARPDRDVMFITQPQFEVLCGSFVSPPNDSLLNSLYTYSYFSADHDALILIFDNARYTNHSSDPNSAELDEPGAIGSIAIRDIQAGEEITEDYNRYDPCPWDGFEERTWMPDRVLD
jgi:hypothetical protein